MRRAIIFFLGVLTLVATACSGSNSPSPTPTPVPGCDTTTTRSVTGLTDCTVKQAGYFYIGTLFPMTGGAGAYGPAMEQGVLLAIDEINQAGGIDGKCLGMVACDTATDPVTAAEAMTELVSAEPMGAVIGPATSSSVYATYEKAKDGSLVMITPSGTDADITNLVDNGFLFRTVLSDAFQGKIAAAIAVDKGFEKIFVINRDDIYGNGLRKVFIEEFEAASGQANYKVYDPETANFENVVQDAKNYDPDAVFLVAYVEDGVTILKKAISDGWLDGDPAWILTDGTRDSDLSVKVGDSDFLEGIIGTSPVSSEDQAFATAYQAAWGEAPGVFASNCYDATYLLALAMAMANDPDNGTQIRDNLAETSDGTAVHPGGWDVALEAISNGQGVDYMGASGSVDFDANGDVMSNVDEWTVESGEVKSIKCWTPEGVVCPD